MDKLPSLEFGLWTLYELDKSTVQPLASMFVCIIILLVVILL